MLHASVCFAYNLPYSLSPGISLVKPVPGIAPVSVVPLLKLTAKTRAKRRAETGCFIHRTGQRAKTMNVSP